MVRVEDLIFDFMPARLLVEHENLVTNDDATEVMRTWLSGVQHNFYSSLEDAWHFPSTVAATLVDAQISDCIESYRREQIEDDEFPLEPTAHFLALDLIRSSYISPLVSEVERDMNSEVAQDMIDQTKQAGKGSVDFLKLRKVVTVNDYAMGFMGLYGLAVYADDPELLELAKKAMIIGPEIGIDLPWSTRVKVLSNASALERVYNTTPGVVAVAEFVAVNSADNLGVINVPIPLETPYRDGFNFTIDAYDYSLPLVKRFLKNSR